MRAHRLLMVTAVLSCTGGHAVRRSVEPVPRPPTPGSTVSVDSVFTAPTVRQRVGPLVLPRLLGSYTALDDSLFPVPARWGDSPERGGPTTSAASPFGI